MANKLKTRKTASKRFTKTSTGKIMREKTGLNHLMRKKDPNRKRNLLSGGELYKGDRKRITRMLGVRVKTAAQHVRKEKDACPE